MSEPDLIPDGDIFGDAAPPKRPRTVEEILKRFPPIGRSRDGQAD